MTDGPRDKLNAWQRNLGFSPVCPMCKHNSWKVQGIVTATLLAPGETLQQPPATDTPASDPLPMAQMVCQACGYVLLIDARRAGLV